ncbi:hypothetical protein ACWIFB_11995 [Dietzia sp. NPDC055340]
MSSPVVLIPGAPVLVPELSGAAAAESTREVELLCEQLRRASRSASRVVVVGTDPQRRTLQDVSSSLRRWGADVRVGRPDAPSAPRGSVPDAALIAWWMLDRAGSGLPRTFEAVDEQGRIANSTPVKVSDGDDLVVVVADGPASLTPRAPVPEDQRGVALDAALTAWLRDGGVLPDPGPAAAAEVGWWSRPSWLALAGLIGDRTAVDTVSWAPFGVGYHAARWEPIPPRATSAAGSSATGCAAYDGGPQ